MSSDSVDAGRCRSLVAATPVVSAAGAVGAAIPFVKSWFSSAEAKVVDAPVQVNVGKIDPGQQIITEWRDKPVFIVHRIKEMLNALPSLEGQLADPDSKAPEQSEYVDPKLCSIKPESTVIVDIYTHLGCSPAFRPEVAPADLDSDRRGGYFCPYHGSHYDLIGRVYKGQPVPLNPPTPPYTLDVDDIITTGVGQEKV